MADITYTVNQDDPNNIAGFEQFSQADKNLINTFEVNSLFDSNKNTVELHILSLADDLVESIPGYTGYKLLGNAQSAGKEGSSILTIDPVEDCKTYGYETGGVKLLYHFLNDLYSKDKTSVSHFIESISPDRTELRLSNLERGQKVQKGLDKSLGGASNVGALQGESMIETLAGQKISNKRTQSLTDATRLQMELLEKSADKTIPLNVNIDKQINTVSSKIKSLRSKKSFTKNDDGEFFNLDSLIDFDPITGVATISQDASKRDSVELDSLKKLVEEEYLLRMQEIVPHELKDGTTINAPRGDIIRLMQEEDEERKDIEAQKIPDQRSGFMSGMNMDYSNIDPSIAELMSGNQR